VIAGLHPMEHVGVATALSLLERAATTTLWDRRRLIVVPMVNPDGFLDVESGLASGRRRFWRHNARGVDLNRNFTAFFGHRSGMARLAPRLFRGGAAALSEPEARAVARVADLAAPRVAVSLHAFGNFIFYPYAGTRAATPDDARLAQLARIMAAAQGNPYRVRRLGVHMPFFLAAGTEIDHFYKGGALSFLLEIGSGPRWSRPETWFTPYRWFTPPSPLIERDIERARLAVETLASVDVDSL
jgi:g-D-glutamyl-meso-diaminopimelate peptidase